MKLNTRKLIVLLATAIALATMFTAVAGEGRGRRGGGSARHKDATFGPGFDSQNNPGELGKDASGASGPLFGPDNNPGKIGSAFGRSRAARRGDNANKRQNDDNFITNPDAGVNPVPSAAPRRGINPIPSATPGGSPTGKPGTTPDRGISPIPSATPGGSPTGKPGATPNGGISPIPSATPGGSPTGKPSATPVRGR